MSFRKTRIRPRAGAPLCATLVPIAALVPVAALASPPAAPSNVIYTSGPKMMNFSWDIVPRSNYYELWFKANDGAAPVKFDERKPWDPRWHNGVSAHLLNWSQVRWEIRACNPSGCSSTGLIDTGSTVVNTVGYVKSTNPVAEARLGSATAVSEDGKTFAAIASDEPVAGGMAAAVYVFRSSNGIWSQIARFEPALIPQPGDAEDASLSLRADGERLFVSLPHERCSSPAGADDGAVHVFSRGSSGAWTANQTFKNPGHGQFGVFAQANEAGNVLAYSQEAGGPRVEIWSESGGHWSLQREVKGRGTAECKFDLSGNGQWLARSCTTTEAVEIFSAHDDTNGIGVVGPPLPPGFDVGPVALDFDAARMAVTTRPRDVSAGTYVAADWKPVVQVYKRDSWLAGYQQISTLRAVAQQSTAYAKRSLFGDSLAMSHAGTYIAVNDPHDSLARQGVWPPDELGGGNGPAWGAVYLFEPSGMGYRLRRHIGPEPVFDSSTEGVFGTPALGNDGKTLVIGEPLDDGSMSGIGAYRYSTPRESSGAVWLY